jgi:general secretion pathway protein I
MTARARRAGFTLLEVMVALAILSVTLMAIADLAGNALRSHVYARDLSAATLLARSKMAELEEAYEDRGFKDFDETEEGDFDAEGHPEIKWRVEVLRPDPSLGPNQLISVLLGGKADASTQELLAKLVGGGAEAPPGSDPQPATAAPGGLMGGLLQTQLNAFAEGLKKGLRETRLTVAWKDGRQLRQFTVATHLVVLYPRAPGGARGSAPDIAPGIPQAPQAPLRPAPARPGVTK